MKNLSLSQQYAVIAFNGQGTAYTSMSKRAVMRSVAAAEILETLMDIPEESLSAQFASRLEEAVKAAKQIKKKDEAQLEGGMADSLKAEGILFEVPDLLGCDMNYYTAGIQLTVYRSEETVYLRIMEGLRAEILEDGPVSMECAILLWLLRESGGIYECFSVKEQDTVQERMTELAAKNDLYRILWEKEYHSAIQTVYNKILRKKHNLFYNPYFEGINLAFPFLERRRAIFIDFVIFGTNVEDRRKETIAFLNKMGHKVDEVKLGSETLLKIDNAYYRIFPGVKRTYKVPVQGVNLVPAYWQ